MRCIQESGFVKGFFCLRLPDQAEALYRTCARTPHPEVSLLALA
jgi:hypothetical protein